MTSKRFWNLDGEYSKEVKLLMEVALLTDLVRDLADRVRQLEAKQ